ncbi:nSTAND1 domain-containing NTPase [Streptomyces sp. NPDC003710]
MVGRPESPLDPSAGPVARLAAELRKLRAEAGSPTYRVMAQRTGQGASTLSQAAAGERLPTLPVVLAYVRACGGDLQEWEERWREAAAEEAAEPRASDEDAEPPYRGLTRFEPGDADLFFGRDQLTDRLLELTHSRRFTAVFGPSGSGKSSLLRAGLIPRLRSPEATDPQPAAVRVLTPGEHPLRVHEQRLTAKDADGETWLIVDQFEELYTLCTDPAERDQFIDRLLAATDAASHLRVVIAVRADFLGRCAEHPALIAALQDATVLAGPMSRDELREAITKPAQAVGMIVERSLTARILDEVEGRPGALPLMSHALLETWRRRHGRVLTLGAYEAAGGLHGAIARTAEDLYRTLTPAQAGLARRILLRLVTPGQGTADTRRPTPRAEMEFGQQGDTATVIEQLTRTRLITLDDDIVDVAHEALITAWPRLGGWIDEDRQQLILHRKLTQDAETWEELGRDPAALYRGTRLATVVEAFPQPDSHSDLTVREHDFLMASLSLREREQRSVARAARRTRTLLVTLSVFVMLAMTAGLVAWQQNRSNERRGIEAEARRVAEVADSMRATDPLSAMRLSLAAWSLAHTPETRSALLGAWTQKDQAVLGIPKADPLASYTSPDGRVLLTTEAGKLTMWDIVRRKRVWTRTALVASPMSPISPDGRIVTTVTDRGDQLWDTTTSGPGWTPRSDLVAAIEDGSRIVATESFAENSTLIQVWDRRSHSLLLKLRVPNGDTVSAPGVLISPNGQLMMVCPVGQAPQVWDVISRRILSVPVFVKHMPQQDACNTAKIDFSPTGAQLAVSTNDRVRIWDFDGHRELPSLITPNVYELQFSQDGRFLATNATSSLDVWRVGSLDTPVYHYTAVNETISKLALDTEEGVVRYVAGTAKLQQGVTVHTLRLGNAINPHWQNRATDSSDFSPDGNHLAIVKNVGNRQHIRVLDTRTGKMTADLTLPRTAHGTGAYDAVSLGDHDRILVSATAGGTRQTVPVALWDTQTRRWRTWIVSPPARDLDSVSDIELTPDGRFLLIAWDASGGVPGAVGIWSTDRRKRVRVLSHIGGFVTIARNGLLVTSDGHSSHVLAGRVHDHDLAEDEIRAMAFSDDAGRLAVADDAGRVNMWDMRRNQRTSILTGPFGYAPDAQGDGNEFVTAIAFSHDGSTLAVGGSQGTLQLWDTASNRRLGTSLSTGGDTVDDLVFGPDDKILYASGEHAPLQRYSVTSASMVTAVCARASGGLPKSAWKTYIHSQPYRRTC